MAKIYYDSDADLNLLKGKKVGVIGYGSQGHAHALNLKESGVAVSVGLYPGSPSWEKAQAAGLQVGSVSDVARDSDVIMMLVPDQVQKRVYEDHVAPHLEGGGKTLMFAHGFNIHFGQIDAARGRRRLDDRAEGPRPPRAPRLHRGRRRAGARRDPPGRERERAADGAGLRQGHRRRRARASSRRPSSRRRRPTSSASRSSSAAASRR